MHQNYKDVIEKLLPDAAEREAFFSCYNETLPRSIKILEHTIPADKFQEYTQGIGRKLTPPPFVEQNDSWYIERNADEGALGKHRLHMGGFFYIQEMAASLAVHTMDITPGAFVLDMCAAPGGKSTQIADKLLGYKGSPGLLVSNEMSSSRIVSLQHNLNRTGAYNTAVTKFDGKEFGALLPEFFDAVLVDAPCSGEGTGFKSDAGTKRWREDKVIEIAHLQSSLLTSAIHACKVGGEIVYATCTLNPWENEGVVAKALEEFGSAISLENIAISNKSVGLTDWDGAPLLSNEDATKVVRFWPHRQLTGGFFIAKLRKSSSIPHGHNALKNTGSSLKISDNLQTDIAKILHDDYGIQIDPAKHFFASTEKQVYLISPEYKLLHPLLYVAKTGVPIFKRHNETELHPLHGLGTCLGALASKNTIQLSAKECQKYSDGYDLDTNETVTTKHKYAVLKRESYGFSVGKVVGNTIKNKFLK